MIIINAGFFYCINFQEELKLLDLIPNTYIN
ncbi:hypothetical protein MCETHM1_02358 [Flavobacteriaceae bacterium]